MHEAPTISPKESIATKGAVQPELPEKLRTSTGEAIMPKLSIGAPDDPYEKEADSMADRVMRMPEGGFIQRKCAHCEEEEKVQRRLFSNPLIPFIQAKPQSGTAEAPNHISKGIHSTRGHGSAMDGGTANFMSTRFGSDFSRVKIHQDDTAARLSNELSARAFTVGSDVYFNRGEYQPHSQTGRQLLAHELTHVLQQGKGLQKKIQRSSYYFRLSYELGVGPSYNYPAAYTLLSPLNETDMLDTLSDMHTSDGSMLQRLINNVRLATGPVGTDRMLAYFLGVKNALLQNQITGVELATLSRVMTALPIAQQQAIQGFISSHRSTATRDLYAGASLPTARERARVERIFNPGATTTTSSTGVVTTSAPSPAAVCSTPAPFATSIRAVLTPQITSEAVAFRARRAAGPNFPIASANGMADLAQREIESYFRPYLAGASRSRAVGTYSLGGGIRASGLLADQSTTTRWQSTDGRMAWLRYWYAHQTGGMNDTLYCEDAQIDAALTTMATDAALIPDIDDYINSWPAEATDGINIQPYLDATQLICQRWDTFTTIIHEFIHILAHPNFENARGALPGNAMEILKEGMDDVLRKELWEGAGRLRAHLIASSRAADRAVIEGGSYTLDTSKVCSHSYYGNLSEAERVTRIVGRENVKLAYFLGQTEYLGIGTGTTTGSGHSLTGLSFYDPAHVLDQNVVAVLPGETREALLLRTNGNQVRDLSNAVIPAATALPASVRIPGVRKVYVHADDSLTSIAVQNGVTPFEIMRANNMTTASITIGSRLLIPRH